MPSIRQRIAEEKRIASLPLLPHDPRPIVKLTEPSMKTRLFVFGALVGCKKREKYLARLRKVNNKLPLDPIIRAAATADISAEQFRKQVAANCRPIADLHSQIRDNFNLNELCQSPYDYVCRFDAETRHYIRTIDVAANFDVIFIGHDIQPHLIRKYFGLALVARTDKVYDPMKLGFDELAELLAYHPNPRKGKKEEDSPDGYKLSLLKGLVTYGRFGFFIAKKLVSLGVISVSSIPKPLLALAALAI